MPTQLFLLVVLLLGVWPGLVTSQTCSLCLNGTYCFMDAKSQCPQHSTSADESSDIAHCICRPGYKQAVDSHACEICTDTEYCHLEVVQQCPAGSISSVGASQLDQCKCKAGFGLADSATPSNPTCDPCPAGFFKTDVGSVACTACEAGKFSLGNSAGTTQCSDCAVSHSSSATGSTSHAACFCVAGYYGDATSASGTCTACPTGKFLPTTHGSTLADCHDCSTLDARRRRLMSVDSLKAHTDSLYYSAATGATSSAVCNLCPDYSRVLNAGESGASVDECECFEGFTEDENGHCVRCGAGTYKDAPGSAACTNCPANTYNTLQGSHDAAACTACTGNSASPEKSSLSTACQCNAGYEGDHTGCAACAPGKIQSTVSQSSTCEDCPVNTYSSDTLTCHDCALNEQAPANSATEAACICNAGFQLTDSECVACEAGYYKTISGDIDCESCATGEYSSNIASVACESCPTDSTTTDTGSEDIFACQCNAGLVTELDIGLAHSDGITQHFNFECTAPRFNEVTSIQDDTIRKLAAQTDPASSRSVVVTTISKSVATTCPENTYKDGNACQPCPAGTTSGPDSYDIQQCICGAGFKNMYDAALTPPVFCEACEAGKYRRKALGSFCYNCRPGAFSAAGAESCSKCPVDTYQPNTGGSGCIDCGDHAVNQYTGATSSAWCLCDAGYVPLPDSDACHPCPLGFYDDGVAAGNTSCLECPQGLLTTAVGSNSLSDCEPCPAGSMFLSRSQECFPCPVGTKTTDGANVDCECGPGFTGGLTIDASTGVGQFQCVACEQGTFKTTFGTVQCTSCPNGKIGTSLETYQIRSNEDVSCESCPSHSYQVGLNECELCFNNSITTPAAVSRDECTCQAGYVYNSVVEECDECAAGKFKDTVSNTDSCSSCPDNTYSEATGLTAQDECIPCPMNSTQLASTSHNSIESCRCDPGTKRVRTADNLVCVPCGVGKFTLSYNALSCDACLANQYYDASANTCQSCPDFSTSPAESYSIQHCTCNAGYFTTTSSGQLVCEPCGEGSYCPTGTVRTQCPANTNTAAGVTTATSADACLCNSGYLLNTDPAIDSFCVPCPENTFCSDTEIISCPINSNTMTLTARTSLEACRCEPGYQRNNAFTIEQVSTQLLCEPCPGGTFCISGQLQNCPEHSSSIALSSTLSACVCGDAFAREDTDDGSFECVPCDETRICGKAIIQVRLKAKQQQTRTLGSNDRTMIRLRDVVEERVAQQQATFVVRTRSNITQHSQIRGDFNVNVVSYKQDITHVVHNNLAANFSVSVPQAQLIFDVSHSDMLEYNMAVHLHSILPTYFQTIEQNFFTLETRDVQSVTVRRLLFRRLLSQYAGTVTIDLLKLNNVQFKVADLNALFADSGISVNNARFRSSVKILEVDQNAVTMNAGLDITSDKYDILLTEVETVLLAMHIEPAPTVSNPPTSSPSAMRRLLASLDDAAGDVALEQEVNDEIILTTTEISTADSKALVVESSNSIALNNLGESDLSIVIDEETIEGGSDHTCATDAINVLGTCICAEGKHCTPDTPTSERDSFGCINEGKYFDSFNSEQTVAYSCSPCSANDYCVNNIAYSCPPNSRIKSSVTSASAISDCECLDGFEKISNDAGFTCQACPNAYFCRDEVKHACFDIDPLLTRSEHPREDEQDCFCAAGYYQSREGDVCKRCPKDHYCPVETSLVEYNVHACQENAYTAVDAAPSKAYCKCRVGFKVIVSGQHEECLECGDGELCSISQDDANPDAPDTVLITCDSDPNNAAGESTNKIANDDHSACVCKPGSEPIPDDHFACNKCGINEYSLGTTDECQACPDSTFAADANGIRVTTSTFGVQCLTCTDTQVPHALTKECICKDNHEMIDGQCVLCGPNKYFELYSLSEQTENSAKGQCVACPTGSSVVPESEQWGKTAQCNCGNGYYNNILNGIHNGCEPCPIPNNYLNYESEDDHCTPCPAGTSARAKFEAGTLENLITDCTCIDDECGSGDAPMYSTAFVNEPLPVNNIDVYSLPQCTTACDTSNPQHKTCNECDEGTSRAGDADAVCAECDIGKYQPDTTQDACDPCPAHSTTKELGSDELTDCLCDKGHFLDSSSNPATCQPCAAGTYKNEVGNGGCTRCEEGTFQDATGKSGCKSCVDETGGLQRTRTKRSCESHFCTVEYIEPSGQDAGYLVLDPPQMIVKPEEQYFVDWSATPGKKFALTTDDNFNILDLADLYTDEAAQTSTIMIYEDTFLNNRPLYFTCAAGTVESCDRIPITTTDTGHWQDHVASDTGKTAVTDCVCDAGLYVSNPSDPVSDHQCTACVTGSYKTSIGSAACTFCGSTQGNANQYGDDPTTVSLSSHCTDCPANTGEDFEKVGPGLIVMNHVDNCLCAPGFEHDGSGCVRCQDDFKYSQYYSNAACEYCAPDHYFTADNTACGHCELTATDDGSKHREAYNSNGHAWAESDAECRCNIGYERDALTCVPCPAGTHQPDLNTLTCDNCVQGTYQANTASTACDNCGSATAQDDAAGIGYQQFTTNAASTSADQCICPNGFQRNADLTSCTACAVGKFRDTVAIAFADPAEPCQNCASGSYQDAVGAEVCKNCPGTTVGIASSAPFDSLYDCDCPAGFAFSSDSNFHTDGCKRCDPDYYPNIGESSITVGGVARSYDECTLCPHGRKTTADPIEDKQNCLAPPGKTHVDDGTYQVEDCAEGTYKDTISNDACTPCSAYPGATSEPGSDDFSDCECDATIGYYDSATP